MTAFPSKLLNSPVELHSPHCGNGELWVDALFLESALTWSRLVLLPNLSPSRAIQALVCFVKHLNSISISSPERVLIFYLMVALQILDVAFNPEFPKYFL